MPRRHFRLQSILRIRGLIEDMRKREWGVIQTELAHEQQAKRELLETAEQHRRRFEQDAQQGVSGHQIILISQYLNAVRGRAKAADRRIAATEKRLAEKLQQVLAATRDRKAMDILRQRFIERRDYEERREEEKNVTEIALHRFARGKGEKSE